jgi:hypothetical protein
MPPEHFTMPSIGTLRGPYTGKGEWTSKHREIRTRCGHEQSPDSEAVHGEFSNSGIDLKSCPKFPRMLQLVFESANRLANPELCRCCGGWGVGYHACFGQWLLLTTMTSATHFT